MTKLRVIQQRDKILHGGSHGKVVTIYQIDHLRNNVDILDGKIPHFLIANCHRHEHRRTNTVGYRINSTADIVQFQNGVRADVVSSEKLPGKMSGVCIGLEQDKLVPPQVCPVSCFRQNELLALADKECKPQFLFNALEEFGQRRLSNEQLLRCSRNAALICNGNDVFIIPYIHMDILFFHISPDIAILYMVGARFASTSRTILPNGQNLTIRVHKKCPGVELRFHTG